jgi:hypothetical protein
MDLAKLHRTMTGSDGARLIPRLGSWRAPAVASALALALALASAASAASRDSADWARVAPYDGIRWSGDRPSVRTGGAWRELVAIDGVAAADLVAASRREYGDLWRKRFDEDIAEVMASAGAPPAGHVLLTLRDPATGDAVTTADVEMSHDKRQQIWRARNVPGRQGRLRSPRNQRTR